VYRPLCKSGNPSDAMNPVYQNVEVGEWAYRRRLAVGAAPGGARSISGHGVCAGLRTRSRTGHVTSRELVNTPTLGRGSICRCRRSAPPGGRPWRRAPLSRRLRECPRRPFDAEES